MRPLGDEVLIAARKKYGPLASLEWLDGTWHVIIFSRGQRSIATPQFAKLAYLHRFLDAGPKGG